MTNRKFRLGCQSGNALLGVGELDEGLVHKQKDFSQSSHRSPDQTIWLTGKKPSGGVVRIAEENSLGIR